MMQCANPGFIALVTRVISELGGRADDGVAEVPGRFSRRRELAGPSFELPGRGHMSWRMQDAAVRLSMAPQSGVRHIADVEHSLPQMLVLGFDRAFILSCWVTGSKA
jgi:hypothetical protein